jgi:hypothetical protein
MLFAKILGQLYAWCLQVSENLDVRLWLVSP